MYNARDTHTHEWMYPKDTSTKTQHIPSRGEEHPQSSAQNTDHNTTGDIWSFFVLPNPGKNKKPIMANEVNSFSTVGLIVASRGKQPPQHRNTPLKHSVIS